MDRLMRITSLTKLSRSISVMAHATWQKSSKSKMSHTEESALKGSMKIYIKVRPQFALDSGNGETE